MKSLIEISSQALLGRLRANFNVLGTIAASPLFQELICKLEKRADYNTIMRWLYLAELGER